MTIGTGVVLFVIGAILAFALNVQLSWINLGLVGDILMIAGVIVFIIGLVLLFVRRRAVGTSQTYVDPASGARTTRQETSLPPNPDDQF